MDANNSGKRQRFCGAGLEWPGMRNRMEGIKREKMIGE
jgi:hypothetical protein